MLSGGEEVRGLVSWREFAWWRTRRKRSGQVGM
jgi:hypothetical protein